MSKFDENEVCTHWQLDSIWASGPFLSVFKAKQSIRAPTPLYRHHRIGSLLKRPKPFQQ